MESSTVGSEPVTGFSERLRIRIETKHPSLGRNLVKDRLGMAAETEGGVEIQPPLSVMSRSSVSARRTGSCV